jgi:hypothetical protein
MLEKYIGRIILCWIAMILSFLTIVVSNQHIQQYKQFQFGPSQDLVILGIVVDDYGTYGFVILFCFLNSGVRTIHHNIIQPWIINNLQDEKCTTNITYFTAYELTLISTTYTWFDFFMYMNIIMSQIDMFLIETGSDMIATTLVTTYYIREREKKKHDMYTQVTRETEPETVNGRVQYVKYDINDTSCV